MLSVPVCIRPSASVWHLRMLESAVRLPTVLPIYHPELRRSMCFCWLEGIGHDRHAELAAVGCKEFSTSKLIPLRTTLILLHYPWIASDRHTD
jgi:hypothetical protein